MAYCLPIWLGCRGHRYFGCIVLWLQQWCTVASIPMNKHPVTKTMPICKTKSKSVASQGREPEKYGWQDVDDNDQTMMVMAMRGWTREARFASMGYGQMVLDYIGFIEGLQDVGRRVTERTAWVRPVLSLKTWSPLLSPSITNTFDSYIILKY
ncbi:hypothetical protein EDD85DRAFT_783011 [Armillaria nabsnona]|nr:hypothetical protein EDD85DRAFT_783011 [Armillaria nabsnona]